MGVGRATLLDEPMRWGKDGKYQDQTTNAFFSSREEATADDDGHIIGHLPHAEANKVKQSSARSVVCSPAPPQSAMRGDARGPVMEADDGPKVVVSLFCGQVVYSLS